MRKEQEQGQEEARGGDDEPTEPKSDDVATVSAPKDQEEEEATSINESLLAMKQLKLAVAGADMKTIDENAEANFEEDDFSYVLKQKEQQKQGADKSDDDDGDDDDARSQGSVCTTTSTIMELDYVRSKVRKSLLSKMKAEKRRIKKKGESSLVTQQARDLNDTIKSSM